MTQMLALRGYEGETKARASYIDVPDVGDHDVLIKVASAGLVPGTFTLLEVGRLKPLPMTLGHEGAGVVAAVGKSVHGFKEGDRVRLHPNLSCGRCRYCLAGNDHMCDGSALMGFVALGRKPVEIYSRYHDGCLAEYVRAPHWQVDHLPDNVNFDVGAKLHYLANAVRCFKVAALRPGATIIILAATGSMGAASIKMARYFGVSRMVLVGRSTERLNDMKNLSDIEMDIVALDTLEEDWLKTGGLARKLNEIIPEGADAILDYTPVGVDLWQGMSGLATGGILVHMGGGFSACPTPMYMMLAKCWSVIGTRSNSRLDALEVMNLLADGHLQVDDLITHKFPLSDYEGALKSLKTRSEPVWMGVVNP